MYPVKYFLNTDFHEMEIPGLDVTGLFTNMRIERESLPEGFYKYSFRDGDEDFLSTLEDAVLINHMGDFICKTELKLGEDGMKDLNGDYSFTDEPIDLNQFFGVDIKLKVAEALDEFMRDVAPYEYADNLPTGTAISEGNLIADIRDMLNDREQVEGILAELTEICKEVFFTDKKAEHLAFCLRNKVNSILKDFPEKRPELSELIDVAEKQKESALDSESVIEREASEP